MNACKTALLCSAAACLLVRPAAAADDGRTVIETVTVTGQSDGVSLKDQTPLIETPQNIQIVSSDFLESQNITTLDDALRNISGVNTGGYYASYDYFHMRGFDASGYIYQDGMRYDTNVAMQSEMFGLEQIDVLKGPSSALYGQGMPGGLVNYVSKTPERENFLNLKGDYGTYQSYEFNFDGNYVINAKSAARVVGVWRHSGTFTDYANGLDRIYLAPSYSWNIDADTTLTLLASYTHNRNDATMPLTAEGTIYASPYGYYSIKTYTGIPGHTNKIKGNRTNVSYLFSHRFNDVFTFQSRMRYNVSDVTWDKVMYTSSLADTGSTLELSRYPYSADGYHSNFTTDNSLSAAFVTGPVQHDLLFGVDYYGYHYHWNSAYNYSDQITMDLFDPDYDAGDLEDLTTVGTSHNTMKNLGVYVQEHAKYGRWTFTGSLRWDGVDSNATGTKSYDLAYTPRLGLTYEFLPGSMVYGSYSTSFLPQSGTTYDGAVLKPETGQQWETGVKSNLLDDRLTLTGSLFRIGRSNVSNTDSEHPNYYVATGKERSRGFEFSAQWQILQNWQANVNYTYTDAVVKKDYSIASGTQLRNEPMNMVNMWTRYSFDGPLKGVSVSGGVYHYSSQAGDDSDSFRLPAYTLVNGQLSYAYGPAEIDLSVRNLFDERWYSGSYSATYVQPGSPRTVHVDLKVAL